MIKKNLYKPEISILKSPKNDAKDCLDESYFYNHINYENKKNHHISVMVLLLFLGSNQGPSD